MLSSIFIGSKNVFNEVLVEWVSNVTDLRGVVWTKSTNWQNTWVGRTNFAKRRYRRYGLLKVINETLFYLYFHKFIQPNEELLLKEKVIKPYWSRNKSKRWNGNSIFSMNVNSNEIMSFLRDQKPDIVFAMCINNYFGKKLLSIPKYGVFLWHEGITPEYKGLYSPFWAIHNLDFQKIGYTLLKMNDEYDAGDVYVQGLAQDIDPFQYHHTYIGHKAIYDSLSHVQKFLQKLEQGNATPIDRSTTTPNYYTYPGISDFIRQRLRLKSMRKKNNI